MSEPTTVEKAVVFRELHRPGRTLILGNVWDVAGARIYERCGFEALGTTSAGLAAAHGYIDRQRIPMGLLAEVVGRIAAAVKIPLSVDLEAGYGEKPSEVERAAQAMLEAGAIGVNLEDGVPEDPGRLYAIPAQLEKIEAVKAAGAAKRIPVFVNARTDLYWRELGDAAERLAEAIRRSNAFLDGGADCVFIPGLRDRDSIDTAVRAMHGPLNVLGGPGVPPIPELAAIGVRRVSLGSAPLRATLAHLDRIGRELLEKGTYDSLDEGLSYEELQDLF